MKIVIEQFTFQCNTVPWCFGMWFASMAGEYDQGKDNYLRNDGKLFPRMQKNALDPDGGTYFPTQQDAQAALDRYNANNPSM